MAMLDEQFEAQGRLDSGLFSYPEVIDVTGCESADLELIQLADTQRLCDAVNETAAYLSQEGVRPILKGIEEVSLDMRLAELRDEVWRSDFVTIEFSDRITRYNSAYETLLAAFGAEDTDKDMHAVLIPGEHIRSVVVLPGKESESLFTPRLILRVATGYERPISVIKDGQVVEGDGQPRWFDFPINRSKITTFGFQAR